MSTTAEVGSAAWLELAREALDRGVTVRLRVYGSSMRPALRDGEQILIRPAARRPAVGQVVAWRRAGRLVVHRVVRQLADGGVVTRGDACGVEDTPCPASDLLGVVELPTGPVPPLPLLRRARRFASRVRRVSLGR